MNSGWITGLFTLLGSLGGLAIGKFADSYQRKKDHRYFFEETYFSKKLTAAEAIVSQYSLLTASLMQLNWLFDRMKDFDSFESDESRRNTTNNLLDSSSKNMNDINKLEANLRNTHALYFDISVEENERMEKLMVDFYQLMDEVSSKSNTLTDPNLTPTEEQRKNYKEHIELIQKKIVSIKNTMQGFTSKIRHSFKQFDV